MVDTGTAIIAGSIISLIGMIIILQLNNSNWFKKQQWKLDAGVVKATNKLKLKKLEKELSLHNVKSDNSPDNSILSSLAPLIKNLDGDQLKSLAEQFLPLEEGEIDEPADGIGGMLLNFAKENPEMVEGLLQGITKKEPGATTTTQTY